MLLVDNDTITAVHLRFQTGGKAAALAELHRRFWLLDTAALEAVERILAWTPPGCTTRPCAS